MLHFEFISKYVNKDSPKDRYLASFSHIKENLEKLADYTLTRNIDPVHKIIVMGNVTKLLWSFKPKELSLLEYSIQNAVFEYYNAALVVVYNDRNKTDTESLAQFLLGLTVDLLADYKRTETMEYEEVSQHPYRVFAITMEQRILEN